MSQLLRQLRALAARLNPREQKLVATFGLLLLGTLLYLGVIGPVVSGRARLERSIANLRSDLQVMEGVGRQIERLQARGGSTAGSPEGDAGFSLFSFVDRVTASSISADSIDSMNPSRREVKTGVEEVSVELRLSRVTLGSVVNLLRGVEESAKPVYVKQMELKRRYDDRSRFDVTLVVATLSGG